MRRLMHTVQMNVPVSCVDLEQWIDTLQAAEDPSQFLQVGEAEYGPMKIRHRYRCEALSPNHSSLFSKHSISQLFGITFHFSCRWIMNVEAINDHISNLTCVYELGTSSVQDTLFKLFLFPFPAFGSERQIANECALFARDIMRKFA